MATKGKDNSNYVIIGGGPAGLSAAEALRQAGYEGNITILSKDTKLPYDRTMLSKWFGATHDKIQLRSADFLQRYGITV